MGDFKHIDELEGVRYGGLYKLKLPTEQEREKIQLLISSDLAQKHLWEETGETYTGFSAKQQEDYDWFLDRKETSNGCFLIKDKNILYKANSFEETIFHALSILNLSVGDFLIITIQKDSYK
jgi:hypothetical protein